MPVGLSKGSRGSHGLRVLVALAGMSVPLAPGVVSGCGSSGGSAAPPAPSATQMPADATVPLVMVITGGGGAPTSSGSSSGGSQDPLGALPDTGSSSGTTSSSGSGSGALSDDGSSDSTTSDGALSDAPDNTVPVCPADYAVTMCGNSPCDYRANTCCINIQFQTRCIPGNKSRCNSDEASIHCLQACECGAGLVCCGVANTVLGVITTECQSVPDGGLCNPHPETNTQVSEQLCATDEECTAGQGCILQTCEYGVTTAVCGLISQAPFNCHPYGQSTD